MACVRAFLQIDQLHSLTQSSPRPGVARQSGTLPTTTLAVGLGLCEAIWLVVGGRARVSSDWSKMGLAKIMSVHHEHRTLSRSPLNGQNFITHTLDACVWSRGQVFGVTASFYTACVWSCVAGGLKLPEKKKLRPLTATSYVSTQ